MKSAPMTALEKGVFWTEYVLKHKGAHFLKPASIKLSLVQLLCLDILFLVLSTAAVCLYMSVKIFRYCFPPKSKDVYQNVKITRTKNKTK